MFILKVVFFIVSTLILLVLLIPLFFALFGFVDFKLDLSKRKKHGKNDTERGTDNDSY